MATPYSPANIRQAIRSRVKAFRPPPKRPATPTFHGQPVTPINIHIGHHPGFYGQGGGVQPAPVQPPVGGGPGQTDVPPPPPPGWGGIPVPGRGGPLSWNPQLVMPDLGGYTDAGYESAKNTAMTNFYKQYHAVLQNLGYVDPGGNYVEGDIALQDRRQHALYNMALADEERDVTQQEQERGTLFSGIRGQHLADAQRQTVQDLGDLDVNTARLTSQGWTDIGDYYGQLTNDLRAAAYEAWQRKYAALTGT